MVRTIKIASEIKGIFEIENFLTLILKDFKISRKIYCKMYLAITEAVNNAIIHGNKLDSKKQVTIKFTELRSSYKCIIIDNGKGFNSDKLPDPLNMNNLRKESGRGIFIMKQYADRVVFEDNGASVILIFNK
ncbi:MAG: ATP-binding protein [Prolixibacteraceae bacterium]